MIKGERERGREREREKKREKVGEREKYNMYFNCPELLFLSIKGTTGALAPISYLVVKKGVTVFWSKTNSPTNIWSTQLGTYRFGANVIKLFTPVSYDFLK